MRRRSFLARLAALVGAMRARAGSAQGVKTRPDDPAITGEMWLEEARKHFVGRIIVGKDLMEI